MKSMKWKIFATLVVGLGLAGCDETYASGGDDGDKTAVERKLDAAQVARGRTIYQKHCIECHGADGQGQSGDWRVRGVDGMYPPPPLDDSAHAWHHPTAVLLAAIRDGSPPGEGKMPEWKGRFSDLEMQDVVAYIKSLWSDSVYRLWQKMERQSQES